MTAILLVLGLLLISVLGSIWSGYVLTILWGWFMVPTFSLPALSIPVAIGLVLVVSYLTHQFDANGDTGSVHERTARAVAHVITKPAVALLVGWIVTHWL